MLGLGLGVAIAPGIRVHAQIVPDGSLGSEGSVTTPMETGVQIDGGALRGDNLFHSFQEFSVPTNSEAFFNNPDVANIFSRVTGGSISDIDGLLRANGTANLFLLNPNGIVFGPNARLDIGGSFVASTANSLVFENGLEFSASDSGDTAPLLSVNVPLGVQFNGNPGSLEATGATLNVSEGESMALVGGEISLDDVEMNAPAGRIDLVGVGEAGQVRFEVGDADSGFPSGGFGVPADLNRASVLLRNGTALNVVASQGGDIKIQASEIELWDSFLDAGIAEGFGNPDGQSGNIGLDAHGRISIANGGILNLVRRDSFGHSGNITLIANDIEVRDGAQLTSSTFGQGNSGSVRLNAVHSIIISGANPLGLVSGVFSRVSETAEGQGGDVRLVANHIAVREGATLDTTTFGAGDAGLVRVEAGETIIISNADAFSAVEETGQGNAGAVSLIANQVEIRDGAQLTSSTFGQGHGGSVRVEATDQIVFSGVNPEGFMSAALSRVAQGAQGDGGRIDLVANRIIIEDGARLDASSFGDGNAGGVTVEGHEMVIFRNADAFSQVEASGRGNAGGLSLIGQTIELQEQSVVSSNLFGEGNAGPVTLEAGDSILISDSEVISGVAPTGRGNAGGIEIAAERVMLRNGAQLNSSTLGQGDAGTVRVEANESILLLGANVGQLTTGVVSLVGEAARGNAGGISLMANRVDIRDGAFVSLSTAGEGNAGTATVTGQESVRLSDSFVLSNVTETGRGNAGGVRVTGRQINLQDGAILSSSTFGEGDAGSVRVEGRDHIVLSNSAVFSQVIDQAEGNAGGVRLNARQIDLQDGAVLSSSHTGQSNSNNFAAGDLMVRADSLRLVDGSAVTVDTLGQGGNLQLNTNTTILRGGSNLQTNAQGEFPGGNIVIDTGALVALENSNITANALNASGGQVIINAQEIFGTEFRDQPTLESDITATSALGPEFSGVVELNTPDIDTAAGLVDLSAAPIDVASILNTDPCTSGRDSEFYVTGRGGLPPNPEGTLVNDVTWVDLRSLNLSRSQGRSVPRDERVELVEAEGWHMNHEGEVILSSSNGDVVPTIPERRANSCSLLP